MADPVSARNVYINWGMSGFSCWGIYGLNLALHWCRDPDLAPFVTAPMSPDDLALDPLRRLALQALVARSAGLQAELAGFRDREVAIDGTGLNCFDDRFEVGPVAHNVRVIGTPTVAVTVFETAALAPEAAGRASGYPVVVAGSAWNADTLRAHGVTNVRKVIQGVDPTLFHPAPRSGWRADRFLVFSGGRLERRKGQDIVLAAFRRFAERRPDALLVAAWSSPFRAGEGTLDASVLVNPPVRNPAGAIDPAAWALACGVRPAQFLDLGAVANAQMPTLLREMDVALFPNRAEGGANLMAMECMACGVPVILSANTGHLDLIEDGNCYPLVQQGQLEGREAGSAGVKGWGESDIDEIVEQLERVYAHRDEARARGLRGAETLARYSWARTAAQMKDIVLSL